MKKHKPIGPERDISMLLGNKVKMGSLTIFSVGATVSVFSLKYCLKTAIYDGTFKSTLWEETTK